MPGFGSRRENACSESGVKYNIDLYGFIERTNHLHFIEGAGLQLRGTLSTSLIALALTAMWAVRASAESSMSAGGTQDQSQSVAAQSPALPVEDAMAQYQGLIVADIRWPSSPPRSTRSDGDELIPQKVGKPLDRELIRESIHKLHDTGRFADIRVEANETETARLPCSFFTVAQLLRGAG